MTVLLQSVNSPADLRSLDETQLAELATEIREFIVRKVSTTGGHLGSNLGAVELTLAVHRVFESPNDYVLWDTGHQAYTHKIVTGRRDEFDTLRQAGGLSGYPSREESEHDWVENSHASTILSYAHGVATAIRRRGDKRRVVAIIGDGSMTGGMAFEALNNIGASQVPVTIVLNDNGRSYAPTVGRLTESLAKLRISPSYLNARGKLKSALDELPGGSGVRAGLKGISAAMREVIEPTTFFEALGVKYIGPLDGHDLLTMEQALSNAASYDGPVVVHVLTQKGKGYPFAEDDEEKCLHDVAVFDPEQGPLRNDAAPQTYTQVFTAALMSLADKHPELVALTAAMPGPTGLLPFQSKFPDRFFDVGIAEQHAVTAAAGMAMGGLRPVIAVYSTFLTRAFDQTNLDVGLHHLPVIFAIDRAGITGDDGASHHGVLDMALCLKVPGMTVLAPSSAQELSVMLLEAFAVNGPVAVRWPKGTARQVPFDEVGTALMARRTRAGSQLSILAVGTMLDAAQDAADELRREGIDAAVWDVRCVAPLDEEMLREAATHSLVVTVEDGLRVGGAGSFIHDALRALGSDVPVHCLGTPVRFLSHGKRAQIMADLGLDAVGIAASVRALTRSHILV